MLFKELFVCRLISSRGSAMEVLFCSHIYISFSMVSYIIFPLDMAFRGLIMVIVGSHLYSLSYEMKKQ